MRSIVWLRRDLRLRDNVALAQAAGAGDEVIAAFVLDPQILRSERIGAPLTAVFFSALSGLRKSLREHGSDLVLLRGEPHVELIRLANRLGAQAIYFNVDYEPGAVRRDAHAKRAFEEQRLDVHACLDHVYLGANEVLRDDGEPYKVYTPYRRAWLRAMHACPREPVPSLRLVGKRLIAREIAGPSAEIPSTGWTAPPVDEEHALRALDRFSSGDGMRNYAAMRDFPAADATSHLSAHLRAGTIGIRTVFARAFECGGEVFASELIWREFYQMILRQFPHVADGAFTEKGARIPWRRAPEEFDSWCEGRTGYPIVDAAMRTLNATGWMHNRLRMIVASFLTKHLLIDWRKGERYFEQRLIDADIAQNNGGWQWCASTGTDSAPYFRIFNPVLQSKKFDPDGAFIRAAIPELRDASAKEIHEPRNPIVDHAFARGRALAAYGPVY